MHASSLRHMQDLVSRYLQPGVPLRVVDVGSYDVNGSYRNLFAKPGWEYSGIDLDRKSTRLNSSHRTISYAVFCLKKKKIVSPLGAFDPIKALRKLYLAAIARRLPPY